MNAIVLLNKAQNKTSFQAANHVRHLFGEKKAGHCGTLDPNATGLLIVLLGSATKLGPYIVTSPKRYHAEFCLGKVSDTEDIWGKVTDTVVHGVHSQEQLDAAAARLTGDILQTPPMYSAIHYNGTKLYELARKGQTVERKPRHAVIDSLRVHQTGENSFTMDASVSSGTYIRTLIIDYGKLLGEEALMTSLVRTGIGALDLARAQTLEEMAETPVFVPFRDVMDPCWHARPLDESLRRMIDNGMTVDLPYPEDKVILMDGEVPAAAYERREDGHFHCQRGLR